MIYRLGKADIVKAGVVLADAFSNDPLWDTVYRLEPGLGRADHIYFEMPVRLCHYYGQVWAPTENLEAVMAGLAALLDGSAIAIDVAFDHKSEMQAYYGPGEDTWSDAGSAE